MSATVHQGSAWRRGGLAQLTGLREEDRRKGKEVLVQAWSYLLLGVCRSFQQAILRHISMFTANRFRFVAEIGITWQPNQRGYPEGFLSHRHNMYSEWLCWEKGIYLLWFGSVQSHPLIWTEFHPSIFIRHWGWRMEKMLVYWWTPRSTIEQEERGQGSAEQRENPAWTSGRTGRGLGQLWDSDWPPQGICQGHCHPQLSYNLLWQGINAHKAQGTWVCVGITLGLNVCVYLRDGVGDEESDCSMVT